MRISDWSSDVCSSDLKSGRTARALGPGNKCRDDSLEDDRQLATRCFPELSLYGWSGPEARPGDDVMVGDAIDDLADIYAELRGVVCLSTSSRSENATWQFRHGFPSRSEERRVGTECVGTFSFGWSPCLLKNNTVHR